MFGGPRSIHHPQLGVLTRTRGAWRGEVELGDGTPVRLSIMGKRRGPDADALDLVTAVADRFDESRIQIEDALRQHARDYGTEPNQLPMPSYVAVIAIDGSPTIEFGYEVPWDEEHTLGACLFNGGVELNGSVLEP